ncbi:MULTISPECIES: LysR substrate-binding domain-containing protein [Bradyrhizobium]|uniref:LysR family transcriptional regulator n=3 Tax=Bradyrhizobium TaxID=374 RepID=A0AAE5X932_9BRAD|nr:MULTISPECIES: LysR substrate-binding domain-containing protein [Bradyrhizobium]MCG2628173.1 LysR substrate-binding domain-containing protein [Bradyrhizobium zhengyangense]MCG2643292.1 LysR substrate-binding domain-containing protein [Bradyrhizobium zhengyangense]MCG2670394.1 LysR substrate-binding domain-containing protein [Bradyrhizobium zhengyangense]MDN4985871.1 LysR substrate-binding domain-containing protein [Bradyrhizobium sp. WYCCWR 13022]MDN5002750.1 LysR substrate-binding domain-co
MKPLAQDLEVFIVAARRGSFAAAATELGASPAYVSKRVALLERALGRVLFLRTARQAVLSSDGEVLLSKAQRVLDAYADFVADGPETDSVARGSVRITASSGIGCNHVAPLVSELALLHPELDIRLEIVDRSVDLVEENVDIDIRVGRVREPHLLVHPIAQGRRILCAAPSYLNRRGMPEELGDLAGHSCLVMRERDEVFERWTLHGPIGMRTINVTAALSTNHGDIIRNWAIAGRGIMLRSYWDVAKGLANGQLVHVLPLWWQPADISAVTKVRSSSVYRYYLCVRYIRERLRDGPFALATKRWPETPGETELTLEEAPALHEA